MTKITWHNEVQYEGVPYGSRVLVCETCGSEFTSRAAHKDYKPKYCSSKCFGNRGVSQETKAKMAEAKVGLSPWNKGVHMWSEREHPRGTLGMTFTKPPITEVTRQRLSESHIGLIYPEHQQEKHWNWQGGITSENEGVRKSAKYKQWRVQVFERDNYTCQLCGVRGGSLHADHIIPFSIDKGKRLELSNGRTLCEACHKKTDTYGGKILSYEQRSDFLD